MRNRNTRRIVGSAGRAWESPEVRIRQCGIVLSSVLMICLGVASTTDASMPGPGDVGPADPAVLRSTGSADFRIPIEVPPGPGGLAPELALRYSSHAGDGPYGVGWGLGLGELRCSTRFGVPDYAYATCKRFELDGQLLTRDPGTNSYHSFVETFQQIDYLSSSQSWQVINPNGTILRYGVSLDSRVMSGPDVARWLLSEIEDVYGNIIFISYDDTTDLGTRYPSLITYGASATRSAGDRSVEFVFDEVRPDPIHDYAGGIEREVTRRLTDIKVSSYGVLVRRYAFGYSLPGVNYTTNRSRLSWVQRFGNDCTGAISNCTGLPRQEYEYTDSYDDGTNAPYSKFAKEIDEPDNYVVDFQGSMFTRAAGIRIADVNGDGLPDVIEGGFPNGFRNENIVGADPADTVKVKLNTGFGFAEDPAWTAAFRSLQVERPRADFVQIRPNGSGQEVLHLFTAGGIVDDPSAPVVYSTVKQPIGSAWPAGMSRPDARYSLDGDASLSAGNQTAGWIEGMGRLFFADVDADGLADIVVSVRLSGVDKVLNPDGTPVLPGSVQRAAGLAIRKVYRNSGDPAVGWLEDDQLAAGLPPFGLVQFESDYGAEMKIPFGLGPDPANAFSEWSSESGVVGGASVIFDQIRMDPCSVRGLYGHSSEAGWPKSRSPDVCANFVNLAPAFQDFNGDGFPDLMVLELADPEALHQGPYNVYGGNNAPLLPDNKARSRAWIQVPDALAGQDRWIRAPEFDLPNVPYRSLSNGGFLPDPDDEWLLFAHSQTYFNGGSNPTPGCTVNGLFGSDPWVVCAPLSYNLDTGVRLVDLNRDGLTDVIWGLYQYNGPNSQPYANYPRIAKGVLLNTGTGWCSSVPAIAGYVESECSEAAIYHPPENSYPNAPWEPSGLGFFKNANPAPASGHLADLNADGFLDYIQANITKEHPGNKAWIFDPAGATRQPQNMWIRDDRYDLQIDYLRIGVPPDPDYLGLVVMDVNGDGAADVIGDDLPDGSGNELPQAFISNSKHSDLLRLVRNGRGGQVAISYESAILQRDPEGTGLELQATDHASNVGEALGTPAVDDVIRWTSAPVVSEIRIAAPNREPDPNSPIPGFGPPTTYKYAHPRFCVESQSDLGFRVVERTRPSGEVVTRSFYQVHGRAGKTSTVVIADGGEDVHFYQEYWETEEFSALLPDEPGRPNILPGLPGSIDDSEVHVGRLARMRYFNLYAAGSATGSRTSRTFYYDDGYGYNFADRISGSRPTSTFVRLRLPGSDAPNSIFGLVTEQKTFDYESATLSSTDFLSHSTIGYQLGRASSIVEMVKARDGVGIGTAESQSRTYDAYGNLTSQTVLATAGDRVTSYFYDGDSYPGGGRWPDATQNSHSVRVGVMDALGGIVSFIPDPGTGAIVETHSSYTDGPSTSIALDVFGRPVESFVAGDGSSWARTSKTVYDDISMPPVVTRYDYPAAGMADADAISSSVVSDGFGGIWKEIGETPTGFVGTLTYRDPVARTIRKSLPVACAGGLCDGMSGDVEPFAMIAEVDAVGRPIRDDTPDGFSIFEYSSVSTTVTAGPWTTPANMFDVVLSKNGKGDVIQRAMDGDRIAWVDECETTVPAGATMIGSCGGTGSTRTYYGYEATGEISTINDARAVSPFDDPEHSLRYHYDTLGRVVQIDDPALTGSGNSLTSYDIYGNVQQTTNARGQSRTHTYDSLNRLTGIVTPAGETNYTILYRPNEKQASRDFSDDYTRTLTFDDLGRVQQEHMAVRTNTGSLQNFHTDYAYDLIGRVTEVLHPAKHYSIYGWIDTTTRYEYDGAFLSQICDLGTATDCNGATTKYVSSVGFDTLGRRTSLTFPGGTRTFSYNAAFRLLRDDFSSSNYQYTRDYVAYDGVGNILSITGSESAAQALDMDETYVYDQRNRLERWTKEGIAYDFDYDDLGNLTLHGGESQVYDDPTRPHAITRRDLTAGTPTVYSYDEDGNVRSVIGESTAQYLDFDSANQIVCLSSNSVSCDTRIAYDVGGKRVAEYPDGGSAFKAYVGDAFLYEYVLTGAVASVEVMLDGERIALKRYNPQLRSATTNLFMFDIPPPWIAGGAGCVGLLLILWGVRNGSLVLVELRPLRAATALMAAASLFLPSPATAGGGTSGSSPQYYWEISDPLGTGMVLLDIDGQRVRHQVFTPFGRIHAEAGAKFRTFYAGHRRNEESGMFYMQARWYDPGSGRFLSVDPMLVVGNPQHQNPYSYVGNNPINGLDPTGLCTIMVSSCPQPDTDGVDFAGPAEFGDGPTPAGYESGSTTTNGGSDGSGAGGSGGAPSTPAAPTSSGGTSSAGFAPGATSGDIGGSSEFGVGAGDLDVGGLDAFSGDGLGGGGGGFGGSGSLGNAGVATSLGGLGSIQNSTQSTPTSSSGTPSVGLAQAYGGSVPEAGAYVAIAVGGLETARAGLLALGESTIARTTLGLTARQALAAAAVGGVSSLLTVAAGLYVAGIAVENGIRLYNRKTGSDIQTPNGILGRELFPVIR